MPALLSVPVPDLPELPPSPLLTCLLLLGPPGLSSPLAPFLLLFHLLMVPLMDPLLLVHLLDPQLLVAGLLVLAPLLLVPLSDLLRRLLCA